MQQKEEINNKNNPKKKHQWEVVKAAAVAVVRFCASMFCARMPRPAGRHHKHSSDHLYRLCVCLEEGGGSLLTGAGGSGGGAYQ